MKKVLTGSVSHTDETIKELRADRQFAVEYLKAALEELDDPDNQAGGLLALRDMAEAYGSSEGINSMKEKRDIFAELTEGFGALKSQRESVQGGRTQVEFIASGLASLENARHTDGYVDAEVLIRNLERKLAVAKGKS